MAASGFASTVKAVFPERHPIWLSLCPLNGKSLQPVGLTFSKNSTVDLAGDRYGPLDGSRFCARLGHIIPRRTSAVCGFVSDLAQKTAKRILRFFVTLQARLRGLDRRFCG